MTSQERQLCGVAAHEQLLKERDELRVVLSDLLQERNWEHRIGALQEAERALRHASLGLVGWVGEALHALGLLSEALRGLPAYPAPEPASKPANAPPVRDWCAICGALPTTGCAHLGPPRPAPQEACCHVYVGDLGEMHQPNCTRRRQALRNALDTEAEAEAEVEAPPATDSTHE